MFYEAFPKNGIISRFGVGYSNINLEKASKKGLFVCNTPNILNNAVAEHTVWLLLSVARQSVKSSISLFANKWNPICGTELRGKKVSICGVGNIGRKIAKILTCGFGMKIHGIDIIPEEKFNKQNNPKESFIHSYSTDYHSLGDSDFVIAMLPVTPQTIAFINKDFISKMKKGAFFINSARGKLVNEDDLYDALKSKYIQAAGLDVFINEPYEISRAGKDLRKLDNVVLTPHIASNTIEANASMAKMSADNIITILTQGKDACPNIVNKDFLLFNEQ